MTRPSAETKTFPIVLTFATLALLSGPLAAQNAKPITFQSLADLDRCAAQNSWDTGVCLEPLEKFAKGRSATEQLAIAKRARLQFKHWVALRFFEPALGTKPAASVCADEDLGLAVVSGLALPGDAPDKARAERIFAGECFGALRPKVEKEIASAGGGYLPDHACPILRARKAMPAGCPR